MKKNRILTGLGIAGVASMALGACSRADQGSNGTTTVVATDSAAVAPAPADIRTTDGTTLTRFKATANAGEKVFLVCKSCHSVEAGQNRVGPTLYAIVGRAAGSVPGYDYSRANRTSGTVWTPEKLFQYLENPQRVVPGTKMTYTGIKDAQQRADVVAYLGTLK